MTIPGTLGAGAVFGGLGEGNVDMSGGYMPLLEEIRKRRLLEQGIGMGPDPAGMLRPPPPQQQMASMMGDIRPTAANPMINPNPQMPQMQQGVGMGPNPLGAGAAMPLPATPPPPPMMPSPYERAMAETPKPGKRTVGGAFKEGLSSMLHGKGLISGLTGDYAQNEYKRKLAEKAAIYGEGDAFRRQQEGDQMKKNEYNLKVREQGSREKLGEGRLDVLEQGIENQRLKGEEQRREFDERRRSDEEKQKTRDQQWEAKFEEWKRQAEENSGIKMKKEERDALHQQFMERMQAAQVGISGGHLGLAQQKFNEEKTKTGVDKDLVFKDGAWYRIIKGVPYRMPDQDMPQQQNPLSPGDRGRLGER